jgi:phosphoribosylamine-glycine ligase
LKSGKYHPVRYRHTTTAFYSLVFAEVVVFHCGTSLNGDELVTAGGRVLAVSAVASSLEDALASVYAAIDKISFEGMVYRRDIAHRQAKFLLVGLAMLMLLLEH